MVKPPDYRPGRRYPTILRIHGGPVWQYYHDFANLDWQVFAANGHVVLGMNPRGSSGRGEKFATGIWAAWGEKDAENVLAGVDWAVKQGIADPERLGVGGWSYGGMLTNQVIARDRRFKAATYQALKSMGRETQLIVYPGESHEIRRLSFVADRTSRYLGWYGKYLGGSAGAAAAQR